MKKAMIPLLLCLAVLLSACGKETASETGEAASSAAAVSSAGAVEATSQVQEETVDAAEEPLDPTGMFSNRDLRSDYDVEESIAITLSGDTAACASEGVSVSGSTVTITEEGVYVLSGTLDNGMVIVDAGKKGKVQLVLDGAEIHSETSAAIYVRKADKVFVTLAEGSENALSSGETYEAIDDNNIDAVIYAKDDLTLNGLGALTITAPGGHGVAGKDSLTITGGSYQITAASHAITGKDDVCIADGSFVLTSGKDGIHSENKDDETLGFVCIRGGSYSITADGDGISGEAYVTLSDGSFEILAGGGSENAEPHSDFGFPGMDSNATEESVSTKGIKASGDLTISGGSYQIDSADDAIHSNGSVYITGGSFDIATGDDGVHADKDLDIADGVIGISASYEGLEGLNITISGGKISLVATDDGINAAGDLMEETLDGGLSSEPTLEFTGEDAPVLVLTGDSGFPGGGFPGGGPGGRPGGGPGGGPGGFPGMMGGNASLVITGGEIYVNASGDHIDANGTIEITGGTVVTCGPVWGDTAILDYDNTAIISGDALFIGTGSTMMAQYFSETEHGQLFVRTGNQTAGTSLKIVTPEGETLYELTPELDYALMIFSGPGLTVGETYTVYVGETAMEAEAY